MLLTCQCAPVLSLALPFTTEGPPCRQEAEGEGDVQCVKPRTFQARDNSRWRISDEGGANSFERLPSVPVLLCVRY